MWGRHVVVILRCLCVWTPVLLVYCGFLYILCYMLHFIVLWFVQLHLDHVSLVLGLPDKANLKWNNQHTGTAAWLLHNNILFISWLMSENVDLISKHASEIPENVSVVLQVCINPCLLRINNLPLMKHKEHSRSLCFVTWASAARRLMSSCSHCFSQTQSATWFTCRQVTATSAGGQSSEPLWDSNHNTSLWGGE